ncbi:hypothetical protein [Planctomicrobium sp. SH664]|uniref:hypothetical protein n=1 Tax=Planctomicrobium sp. SH664 TaxID=3448125 RepID=UPI003F5CADFB
MPESQQHRFATALIACSAVGAVAQLGLLWGTTWPLGVRGEWTWERIGDGFDPLAVLVALVVGGLLLGYVWFGARLMPTASAGRRWGLLAGLCLLGGGWLTTLISAVPGIAGTARVPFVLYYERCSGYFWQARYQVDSLKQFLQTYPERIQDSSKSENYLHLGTHPPGLTTCFVALIGACERSPRLTAFATAAQPGTIREAFEVVRENEARSHRDLRPSDCAALWLGAILVGIAAVSTCLPLFALLTRDVGAEAAWWTASMWLMVPAMAIFYPKSDVMFPFFAMLAQWQWLTAFDRRSPILGVAAGLTMFLATFFSLAFVPLGLILVLQFFWRQYAAKASPAEASSARFLKSPWGIVAASAVAFSAPVLFIWAKFGLVLPQVWIRNLSNHAAFYEHHTRSYFGWLWTTPLELAGSLGAPIACCAVAGLWMLWKKPAGQRGELLIPALVWGLLWLSGKNRGEAARLWVFLMPFALLWGGIALNRLCGATSSRRTVTLLWLLQLVVAIGTVIRIDGFHFAELLP